MARYALVIGIGENAPPFSSLSKTIGDARAIAQVLKEHGDFRVELLTQSKQVQSKALAAAVKTFVEQRAAGATRIRRSAPTIADRLGWG